MMTSEQKWKAYYRAMKSQKRQSSARRFRRYMCGERREAALERTIAAQAREINGLKAALISIGTATGRNGITASNIIRYVNQVLDRYK